ncbi:MAG: nuclear transport factor 2 family protein [Chitinophagaceae bacterium]
MNNVLTDTLQVHDVQRLMSSYCRFVDKKKWDQLERLLVKDVNLVFQDEAGNALYSFDSPGAFTQAAKDGIGESATVHHLHNPEIEILTDTEARGIWAMEDRFYFPVHAPKPYFHGYGHYHVTFIRINEDWQILDLLLTRVRLVVTDIGG